MNSPDKHILAILLAAVFSGCCRHQPAEVVVETAREPHRASLFFAGDAMCHMPQVMAARRTDGSYDFSPSFEHIAPAVSTADVAVVNLETVISPDGLFSGYPAFSSPAALAAALKNAGFDIAVTANNHCCDRGAKGIRSTARCLDSLGLARTGTFTDSLDSVGRHPLRFVRDSISFALFSYTYGTNGIPVPAGCIVNRIDTAAIRHDLATATDADCRIIFIHWGSEYARTPDTSQRALAAFMHSHGADIVIGSHPHVVQPADTTDGITVFSLGNFVSNQRKRYCNGGITARIDVTKDNSGMHYTLECTPVYVTTPGYRILPPEVADTISLNAVERFRCDEFFADTRAHMQPLRQSD